MSVIFASLSCLRSLFVEYMTDAFEACQRVSV